MHAAAFGREPGKAWFEKKVNRSPELKMLSLKTSGSEK